MATAQTSSKKSAKLSPKEKRAAVADANRKAQLQWWILGAVAVVATVAAIVLISIFTEGTIPTNGGHGGGL